MGAGVGKGRGWSTSPREVTTGRETTGRGKRQKKGETEMSGLYREEPLGDRKPRPWAGRVRTEGRVCQVRTEGCRENLEARSTLVMLTVHLSWLSWI